MNTTRLPDHLPNLGLKPVQGAGGRKGGDFASQFLALLFEQRAEEIPVPKPRAEAGRRSGPGSGLPPMGEVSAGLRPRARESADPARESAEGVRDTAHVLSSFPLPVPQQPGDQRSALPASRSGTAVRGDSGRPAPLSEDPFLTAGRSGTITSGSRSRASSHKEHTAAAFAGPLSVPGGAGASVGPASASSDTGPRPNPAAAESVASAGRAALSRSAVEKAESFAQAKSLAAPAQPAKSHLYQAHMVHGEKFPAAEPVTAGLGVAGTVDRPVAPQPGENVAEAGGSGPSLPQAGEMTFGRRKSAQPVSTPPSRGAVADVRGAGELSGPGDGRFSVPAGERGMTPEAGGGASGTVVPGASGPAVRTRSAAARQELRRTGEDSPQVETGRNFQDRLPGRSRIQAAGERGQGTPAVNPSPVSAAASGGEAGGSSASAAGQGPVPVGEPSRLRPMDAGNTGKSPVDAAVDAAVIRTAAGRREESGLQTAGGRIAAASPAPLGTALHLSGPASSPPRSVAGVPTPDSTALLFEQLVERFRLEQMPGSTRFTVQVRPEHLGRVEIETRQEGELLTAVIRAEDPRTRHSLEVGLDSILQRLEEAGIEVHRAEVADFQSSNDAGHGHRGAGTGSRDRRATAHRGGLEAGESGAEPVDESPEQNGGVSYFA